MLEHQHLIVRAEILRPPTSPEYIKNWITKIINSIGMKLAVGLEANPIAYYCNLKGNEGLTGAAILETSHCAVHFWDNVKPGIMQFDLYTCSNMDPHDVLKNLDEFQPVKVQYKFLDREHGLVEITNGQIETP